MHARPKEDLLFMVRPTPHHRPDGCPGRYSYSEPITTQGDLEPNDSVGRIIDREVQAPLTAIV